MRKVSDWRSHETASDFETHDRADLAQEFLRRNASYKRDYIEAEILADTGSSERTVSLEALGHRWGLSIAFPPDLSPLTHPAHWCSDFAPTMFPVSTNGTDLML